MATFDQLSAEQRAIIELVLKQGQQYDQLGDMLGMPSARVRELAREALVRLSPVSAAAVEESWRGQLADYLLNQQAGPEATATRGHLRRSEAARGWARSVLDSLDQFYDVNDLPTIPAGEPEGTPPPPPARPRPSEPGPLRGLSTQAQATLRRRQLLVGGVGALVIVVFAVLVWPVGLLGGEDDGGSADRASATGGTDKASGTKTRIAAQLALAPIESLQGSRKYAGVAVIVQSGDRRQLVVRAQLPANKKDDAYQVWLYNSDGDARSLGASTTDARGVFEGTSPLPGDFEKFKSIDISRESRTRDTDKHSGDSVLRGAVADFAAPEQSADGAQTTPAP